jgi:hypothetical protein
MTDLLSISQFLDRLTRQFCHLFAQRCRLRLHERRWQEKTDPALSVDL